MSHLRHRVGRPPSGSGVILLHIVTRKRIVFHKNSFGASASPEFLMSRFCVATSSSVPVSQALALTRMRVRLRLRVVRGAKPGGGKGVARFSDAVHPI